MSETRTAIVTGASSGIGAAIAKALAARGFAVALGARRVDKLSDIAKQIEAAGGRAAALSVDLSDAAAVDTFFDAAEAAIGPVDVLVNNAGVCLPGLLHETTPEDLQTEIATNLIAPALLARRAIGSLLARGARGDLIFISSENVVAPRPFQPGYTASKWGLEGLARTLRLELDGTGIRSTIVRPGPTFPTDFARGWNPGLVKRLLETWQSWGIQRHLRWLPATSVADVVAMVATASGRHPLRRDPTQPRSAARAAHRWRQAVSVPIPRLSGGIPLLGHLLELRRNPLALMQRCRDECGEMGTLRLAGQSLVMLYGEAAQEAFFRAPDEQLDQAAAYPFMKPVFGPGVVFDATPEQRKQALRNRSLRDQAMRGHAEGIAAETEQMTAGWGDAGSIDLLDFFAELTIYTSSAALIGPEFREELGPELVPLFGDLERGTDAFAYVNPHLPLPSFRKRDRARAKLVAYLQAIFERRAARGSQAKDLFQILYGLRDEHGKPRYDVNTITGMFISLMFAGHHTTSTTSSWALLELCATPSGCSASATSSTRSTPTTATSPIRRCARSPCSRTSSRRRCACIRRSCC